MTATKEQVERWKEIYDAYRDGESQLSLARRYDLCPSRIREIIQQYEHYLLLQEARSDQSVS